MNTKKMLALLLIALLSISLAGCGSGSSTGGSSSSGGATEGADTITIYEGQFSEMWLVHRMVKLLVEEHTDAKVVLLDEMAPVQSYNEILRGNADLMNCYDGTLLTTYLHLDPSDVPAGANLYDFVNQEAVSEGVQLLDKLGINNTYAVAVPQSIADKYNLNTISDLAPVADQLVFGAEHDFFTEEGSAKYNPMVAFYGLNFKEGRQLDLNLKYSAVESGNIDVTLAYSTDGLNKKHGLKILEDDRSFFPEYNGAILVRTDLFERLQDTAPNLKEVLNMLGGLFTDEEMVNLTYAVDVDGMDVEDVAREYLQQKGLLS